jgi:hypothetical protein
MNRTIKIAALNALGTAAYITLVATLLNHLGNLKSGQPDTVFAPIFFLTLLVISATITGGLVLGRPVMWYIDGKKREAIVLLGCTVAALAVILLVVLGIILAQ